MTAFKAEAEKEKKRAIEVVWEHASEDFERSDLEPTAEPTSSTSTFGSAIPSTTGSSGSPYVSYLLKAN